MKKMAYTEQKNWSANKVVEEQGHDREASGLIQWWYNLTAIPEAPADSTFLKREAARKSRLTSTVLFFLVLVLLIFQPCCLFLTNKLVSWMCAFAAAGGVCGLVLNKKGKTMAAGVLAVICFELALTTVIFTTTPLDETSIQLYDLYIMAELLAVSLLPIRSVFVFALINSVAILISLIYQPHTAVLAADLSLSTQFIPVMIRPIGLQIMVAGVAYMWVQNSYKAIVRADRAEMIAKLEHTIVDQKKELEQGIEQILQTHVAVANGNLNARAPLTQDNILWQIARALNTLLVRLQRATQAERELEYVKQAIVTSIKTIQQAEQQKQRAHIPMTQTALDPLLITLQGKTVGYTSSNLFQRPPHTGQDIPEDESLRPRHF